MLRLEQHHPLHHVSQDGGPGPPGETHLRLVVRADGHEVDIAPPIDLGPAQEKDVQPAGLSQVEKPLPLPLKGPIGAPGHEDLRPGRETHCASHKAAAGRGDSVPQAAQSPSRTCRARAPIMASSPGLRSYIGWVEPVYFCSSCRLVSEEEGDRAMELAFPFFQEYLTLSQRVL